MAHADKHADTHSIGGADPLSGIWQKLSEVSISSGQDYVDFINLDINSDLLYALFFNLYNNTGSTVRYFLYVNGDYTDTDYYTQVIYGDGSTIAASRNNDPGFATLGAGYAGIGSIFMFLSAEGRPRWNTLHGRHTSDCRVYVEHSLLNSAVANITSIRIQANTAGGISAGSKLLLCKVRS